MPKEYFSLTNIKHLQDVPSGGTIHVVGVSGVAMAQLAVALTEKGYAVSGSDKEFYEPMGSYLRSSKVKLCEGYAATNVPEKVDLVVIGNAISYGHPEVEVVEQRQLPYTLFPEMLYEVVIKGRHSIVVTGTHGKTTTTALIASTLHKYGIEASYFVGGISQDLPKSLAVGKDYSVVEGDEYDSAFFAKVPKFDFYHPDTCIVNAVEFDHADIYPSLESVNAAFTRMVESLPKDSKLIICPDQENVAQLLKDWRKKTAAQVYTFGVSEGVDFKITSYTQEGLALRVVFESKQFGQAHMRLPVPGLFNAKNGVATFMALALNDLDPERILNALASYKPVKRRQEIRYEQDGLILIEDFAHHPTAVFETVNAIKAAYPDKKLWAVFEPRSNTSRRKVFEKDYLNAFGKADKVVLCEVEARHNDVGLELLDVKELSNKIGESGKDSICLHNPQSIAEHLNANRGKNDVWLIMSNGSFGGLIDNLLKNLGPRPT